MEELELIFADLFAFIDEYIKDFGEPVNPSPAEMEDLKRQIIEHPSNTNPFMPKTFHLIERVAGEILFSHNLDKYLGLTGDFDLLTFHSYIQDDKGQWDYLKDYLTWGKAGYMFFKHIARYNGMYNFSFHTRFPMKFKDGTIYWVIQESHPLETDKDNNILSHLNTYTVSHKYTEKSPIPISAEFFYKGSYCNDWNLMFSESRFAIKPFSISKIQREILFYYYLNPHATVKDCSTALKYPINTIKKYISDCQRKQGILDHARSSFPNTSFAGLKDVIYFLDRIGWFRQAELGYKLC